VHPRIIIISILFWKVPVKGPKKGIEMAPHLIYQYLLDRVRYIISLCINQRKTHPLCLL
jgi:hypothetical protein